MRFLKRIHFAKHAFTAVKYTPLFLVIMAFCDSTAFAKSKLHYKYAKEEFKPLPRFWGSVEYMNMWEQDGPVNVPLITSNSSPAAIGYIGETGTTVVYGNGSGEDLDYGISSGGRITLGSWIDDFNTYGVEFTGFLLEKSYTNFAVTAPGGNFPIIAVPYYATQTTPGQTAVSGNSLFGANSPTNISVNTGSQLWDAELNFVYNLTNYVEFPLEALIGFRYTSLDESLSLNESVYDTSSEEPTNGVASFTDDFKTQNNFYGLQLGLRSQMVSQNKFTLDVTAKLALGANAEVIDISGNTLMTNNSLGVGSRSINAGIFAQSSNEGSFSHNTFAVLPEAQIKVGYMVAPNVHPYIGYDVMYINNVVRPGDQMDTNINPTESLALSGSSTITGALSPSKPGFSNTSFLIQGFVVGVDVKF